MPDRWRVREGYLPKAPALSSNARGADENVDPKGMVHCRHEIAKRRNSAAGATDASSGRKKPEKPVNSSLTGNSGDPDPGNKPAAVECGLRQDRSIRQRFRTSSLIGLI